MRRLSRITGTILILIMLLTAAVVPAYADVWEFGTSGSGKNPFTPRGYLVDTDKGQHWLSSRYDNSGFYVSYSGVQNGIDYLEAEKEGGGTYTFYAMTDRNPWTDKTAWVAYGKKFLFAYKNGRRISNFNDYVQTPAVRADRVDPSGQGTCWAFKIVGFELEPGCLYEFGFLRGMQANNGITLVLAENEKGEPTGYIQQTEAGLTSAERAKYDDEKYDEFEFISSWEKNAEGTGFIVNTVPMRFSVQTYADLTEWETAAAEAEQFLASVSEEDFRNGEYIRENIDNLRHLLDALNEEAEEVVRLMLQTQANAKIRSMKAELNEMLEKAKSEKPEPADMEKLLATIAEAEALYAKASVNMGIDIGQYGQIEVDNLKAEISNAKKLDEFYPQHEIDAQVQALEEAMIEVKASKVMEEQMIFYDKVTGIYVIAPVESLPEETELFVRVMDEETDEYKAVKPNLAEEETEAVYYKIQFYEGDKNIQPSKEVEVQMPVDINISQEKSTVYSVDENGDLNAIASVLANGTQIFKTPQVGDFVLAGSTATEEEKAEAKADGSEGDNSGEQTDSKNILKQKEEDKADNETRQLEEEKKKKEEYKDPIDKILKRNENTATFSNDVRKETDPIYIIYVAIVLAIAAAVLGIRGIIESRKSKEK